MTPHDGSPSNPPSNPPTDPPTDPRDQHGHRGDDDARWEGAMTHELERRVRDLHEAPLTLDGVRRRARGVQRRRRATVAGAVLATAAVITPVALLVTGTGGGGDVTPDVAADLGAASYLDGRTLHRTDGTEVPLDHAYDAATTLGDRLLATRWTTEDGGVTDVLDDEGRVVDSFGVVQAPVADGAHEVVVWIADDGTLRTRSATAPDDGRGDVQLGSGPLPQGAEASAITGSPACGQGPEACFVYLLATGADGRDSASVVLSDPDGPADPEPTVPDVLRYQDAAADRVATITSADDVGSCGGVYGLREQDYLFETCDRQADDLSPDGTLVVAPPAYYDALGPSDLQVLDAATGEVLAEVAPDEGWVTDWAWRDDGSLLVQAWDGEAYSVLRVTTDGQDPTTVAGPVETRFDKPPFTLVETP